MAKRVSHGRIKCASRVFHGNFKDVSRMFQGYFKSTYGCCMRVYRVVEVYLTGFLGCFKEVSLVLKKVSSCKYVSRKFQGPVESISGVF